ncbi:MAG TPA: immunoglobulin-like domain-containing protein, partial [Pricia sp.]|nr:immunoglobulin-like domain-containing protein [Pricia sp.]
MKNFVRTTAFLFFALTSILSCTKEINLKTEVEFSVTEQHKAEGFVNEDLPTTVTVLPEEILENFSYSYSYSVSQGVGHFRDDSGKRLSQEENIVLYPFSASMIYVGAEPGEHIVKVIASDNYGFTEEIEIEYILSEIPPVTWTATSTVKRIALNNSAPITVTFEKSPASSEVDYERKYYLVSGSGMILGVEPSEQANIDLDEFKPIAPGSYALLFTPDATGTVVIGFDLRGGDGEEYTTTLQFEVLEEIVDTVIPKITLLGDHPLTVIRGSNFADPGATALDDVDGDISQSIVVDISQVDTSTVGSYQVIYRVSDTSGNAAVEVIRRVEVIAGDDPRSGANAILTFTFPGQVGNAVIDEADHSIKLNVPFGTDVDVAPTELTASPHASISPSPDTQRNFGIPVTYTVTAENGSEQEWTIRVTVNPPIDSTAPVIQLIGDDPQMVGIGQAYTELGATANDDFDGNISDEIAINGSMVNTGQLGNYEVTYNVTDAAGNRADEVTRTVRVVDTTAPTIILEDGKVTMRVGELYIEPGYSAEDNVDGILTGDVIVVNNLDTHTVGSYTVTYDVSDNAGNAAEQQVRTVEVVDTTPPVLSLVGHTVIMSVGQDYDEPGYSAFDNADGDITGNVTVDKNLDTHTVGVYTLTYNVTDSSGNAAEQQTRTVEVVDTTAPVITLYGAKVIISAGQSFDDPGYSAMDNVDGDLTGNVVVDDDLNPNTLGTYTVTYDVSDAAGNAAVRKTRTVEVIDTTPPLITLLGGEVILKVHRDYTEPGYTASDNIDGNLYGDVVISENLDTDTVGTYSVTYDVSDASGNRAEQKTRTVRVIPRETSFDASTGIYTAPAGSMVSVSLNSGGSTSGTGSANGGGGSASTCWGGAGGSGCNGFDSYTFVMPASGHVSFTASHNGNGGSNSTVLKIAS